MDFDSREFRSALGCFATGIAVITAVSADGHAVGVTVNSFSSVSLDPPLVLYCLGKAAQSFDALASADSFAVNVLAEDQKELSVRFSRSALQDRFAGLSVTTGVTGAPILDGCLATLDCTREAMHDAGDHIIIVGRVQGLTSRDGRPLLYYRGAYAELAS
ncbi:flavin reductase family protein [Azospirillum sp. RWY-5-1]|uniref:Flavin reductase family protein n=1 Tax=Azospirillum oleiclasticum TaxID=2735135 RepID=A0ABX2TEQ6_9PROT|nr:flavin reductase family protein [Azospirillum oleiclasticum]NYZ14904.1 flavin reductase family protein [Azospirillum oleiclasticum]NYZ22666.1 flavin reductase family protein [Azospirillum oleiclasticum]